MTRPGIRLNYITIAMIILVVVSLVSMITLALSSYTRIQLAANSFGSLPFSEMASEVELDLQQGVNTEFYLKRLRKLRADHNIELNVVEWRKESEALGEHL